MDCELPPGEELPALTKERELEPQSGTSGIELRALTIGPRSRKTRPHLMNPTVVAAVLHLRSRLLAQRKRECSSGAR